VSKVSKRCQNRR